MWAQPVATETHERVRGCVCACALVCNLEETMRVNHSRRERKQDEGEMTPKNGAG